MRDDRQAIYQAVEEAARRGDLAGMRAALGDPPEFPNVQDPYVDEWVLTTAIFSGPTRLVAELLEAGADPNVEDPAGFPPLLAALDADEPLEVVRLLVAHGADLAQRGTNDWTALHRAANYGLIEVVRFLLEHGADPHLRTRIDDNASPREEAERAGHEDVAQLLRAHEG